MTDNNDERTLDLPNITLPFFAYGIFKPGQLAYSKIRNHVAKTTKAEINYPMRHRDGVPILINRKKDHFKTKGCIITFREGQEEETYLLICKTLLKKLYEWETIEINGKMVNVLFGVNPDYGSDSIEFPQERINFNGKNDPLFDKAIKLIEKNLSTDKNPHKMESFFELQMNYMLLWSAIDRFSSLKYNKAKQIDNLERFARQKEFKEGIKKFKDTYHRPVYSTNDLEIHEFDADDYKETLHYYYTLRCNVVHNGKSTSADYSMLKKATEELLQIFNDILENTFNETCS